ncbi:MAG: lipase secretion chaperone [Enhygromyxa sp.]
MTRRHRIHIVKFVLATCLGALACEADSGEGALVERPRSLDDTQLDGHLSFDASGEFVFDEGAQQAFDYFLTAEGELSPAEFDAWVAAQLRAELGDGPALAQVMTAWSAYQLFRREAAALLEDPGAQGDLRGAGQLEQVEQRLLAALDEHLGDTPFAAAERQRIERGFALHRALSLPDPEDRAAELARLDVDEARRFAESRAGRYLAGHRALELARESQADAATIHALRVQHFDALEPGAAERLAALDARRAAWAERVREYEAARERLREGFVGSVEELDASIAELEAARFSPAERRRLRALQRN